MKLAILKGLHRGLHTRRAETHKNCGIFQQNIPGYQKQTKLMILRAFARSNRTQSAFVIAHNKELNYSMKVMHGDTRNQ
jgi:hypothetical protein